LRLISRPFNFVCAFFQEISPWLMVGEHSRQQKRKFNHGQDLSRMRPLCLDANKQSNNSGAAWVERKNK
jgi:hypothetical protein